VRTFGLEGGYPVVQAVAYTPYFLVIAVLVLATTLLMRRWMPAVVAALAVLLLVVAVLPRGLGSADQPDGGPAVRLIAFNLARGKADLGQLIELARERDVALLSLQEVTPAARVKLRSPRFREEFPHRILMTDPDAAGGAILSRYPLEYLGRPATAAFQPRAVVRAPGAGTFELMSVHPYAPAGPKTTPKWNSDYEEMPTAGGPGPPRVLAGDFNATLDHRNLRELVDTGFRDAGDVTGSGLTPTWPSRLKWPLPVTIDHVLAEPPVLILDYGVESIARSDHRAVYVELGLPEG
jgi:endonuclease/exonuclease/phosphatase (EEP) superfamily protein YafD